MTGEGTVREWHPDDGWGVIDSAMTPGGCWAHFGSVLTGGYRALSPGQVVSFEFEAGWQDGFDYRAVAVWSGDERPAVRADDAPSGAYHSSLHIEFDDPADAEGPGSPPR
ncbi:cold shock domain-containing protein [Actinoplanes bogorensis]|uniref:Cold shock domain-containing protein n=1 Tax=Paractinoplanes bogorensis TaxID=1610840 RepID=A0ABS5YK47_9ACTN|nr:cold shock domain-containing protein [Actinoplanes bogorensis]MBU2663787.1 cold shock domain-containing protein [Actinoplanes bogorensis]